MAAIVETRNRWGELQMAYRHILPVSYGAAEEARAQILAKAPFIISEELEILRVVNPHLKGEILDQESQSASSPKSFDAGVAFALRILRVEAQFITRGGKLAPLPNFFLNSRRALRDYLMFPAKSQLWLQRNKSLPAASSGVSQRDKFVLRLHPRSKLRDIRTQNKERLKKDDDPEFMIVLEETRTRFGLEPESFYRGALHVHLAYEAFDEYFPPKSKDMLI